MEKYSCFIISLFVTSTAAAAALYVALKILNWVWFKPKKLEKQLQEQGLKGNPYRLIYGDLKEMKKMLKEAQSKPIAFSQPIQSRTIPLFQDLIKKYGKNTYVWVGPEASVIVMDPESIKEVTLKHVVFQKKPSNPLIKLLLQGLVSHEGDKWASHRKIMNPVFHQDKLKNMLPAFHTSAVETVNKWESIIVAQKEGSSEAEVDVWPYLQTLTSDAISRTAFGTNFEQGKRIFELQREQAELTLNVLQSLYIPGWRFLPTKMNRRMKSISNYVNKSISDMISERMKAMGAGEACEDDLLGTLLESNFKEMHEHGNNKEVVMNIQDIIQECKLFYFVGQETTSTLLVWTMILLSKYSNWQTRARQEVEQFFGTNKPDYDGLHHLKIVNMILYEVLRLYPPVPSMARKATKEIKLGKVTLPAGILLTLPTMLLHHDTEIWGEDALEFNPDRFAEGISHATKGQVAFFPFGWGPRICIGQNFAMLEAKMAMALILQRFSFELSPSYSHAPISILTIQPQHGAHLILHKI